MTTEQMDWMDEHYPRRFRQDPKRVPMVEPWNASFTCDWGACSRETIAWRWSESLREWLPVCHHHRPAPRQPFSIRPIFAWYDMWIGAYWDRTNRRLYIFPVPMLGVVIQFATEEGREKE